MPSASRRHRLLHPSLVQTEHRDDEIFSKSPWPSFPVVEALFEVRSIKCLAKIRCIVSQLLCVDPTTERQEPLSVPILGRVPVPLLLTVSSPCPAHLSLFGSTKPKRYVIIIFASSTPPHFCISCVGSNTDNLKIPPSDVGVTAYRRRRRKLVGIAEKAINGRREKP